MKERRRPPRRVAVRWDRSLRGTVLAEGPEQTEVRLDGERQGRIFINTELVELRPRAEPRRRV